ncbi:MULTISPECIES: 3-deoxy-7-phosphoheptulonate synthase [Selenomonas]|uniref:3-deoxy-7-phosphoheptulonate synthase n=1 Tax=Selenomonas artemidis F0399 TaxID=749551 RepID=E7MZU5_9FIRM|nr:MULTISPECIES: 3-deoxy-7-phosphoheptulonate synthase [Selenomonas]EFR40216.1 3-deoxy-7-phosphoheptulonate synthase [Selenomonas sp. oral taxon 137 str. F0430]EFW30609.1 3-deoxy-7-phosphoheptulonate synthase [Selenomonas artemidis F0399]EJP31250.1 3-deoxy-7-phosphoheptulonate synthase [Selenomonas sp. FOBRC9]MBF1681650.1 3-deoxy-7-phosphoheptulonate synthase [Selenomonas artemidis]
MIIVMSPRATQENVDRVMAKIEQAGLHIHPSRGEDRLIIGVIGDKKAISALEMNMMEGVEKTVRITEKYKLVSRDFHPANTIVDVAGFPVGGEQLAIMAGPCSVESYDQLYEIAVAVKAAGAQFLRGGAFKPRTSPYDFQGLGLEGLKILRDVADKTGLRVVTEIVDKDDLEAVSEYADLLQIGARNMQNFQMLKAIGKSQKPVLFKRGLSATISEWLNAAEYIASGGNENIIFCERGIRTFETYTRNTMDLNAVAALKELTHFPVIADPSHGTGRWRMVRPIARASVAVGADGLIIEVHCHPELALSDGDQSLIPRKFEILMDEVRQIAPAVGRRV